MAVALVGALALAARPMPAHADAALVLVWPDVLVLQVGQESEVEVLIEDVTALYGVDCRLEFDRDLFEVLDADAQTQGVQVTAGSYPHPDMVVRNEANNTAGTVWYAATQLNPREPAAGSGTVFRMRVRGKAPGSGTIHISYLKLVDRTPVELERELSDGDVTVSAQGGSSSTVPPPTATRTPTATPTSTQTPVPTNTTAPGQPTSTPAPSVTPPPTAPPSATPWPAQATAAPTPTLASGYPVPDQPTAAATAPLARAATALPGGTPAATASAPGQASPAPIGPTVAGSAYPAPTAAGAPSPGASAGAPAAAATPSAAATAPGRLALALPPLPTSSAGDAPPRDAAPRAARPLLPPELFTCAAVALVAVVAALSFYLARRVRLERGP